MATDSAYKMIEIVGTSRKSFADATAHAVERAGKTLHGLSWFEATELRGSIKDGKIDQFQVKVKIAFRLDEK